MRASHHRPVVVVVAALALTGGCRAVLGIDDERPLRIDGADGGGAIPPGSDATTDGTADAAVDVTPIPLGPVDHRFASYPLPPDTVPESNYVVTTDTVEDKTTGLVWQRGEPVIVETAYADAELDCNALDRGGASDWRVPTRIELTTILDWGQPSGAVNVGIFWPGVTIASIPNLWTSSVYIAFGRQYVLDLVSGSGLLASAATMRPARCVRGGPSMTPTPRYGIEPDIVHDRGTKLVWARTPLPKMTRTNAATACTALGSMWRLPRARELASLVDESRASPPLLDPAFATGEVLVYWTGTSFNAAPATTAVVSFFDGNIANITDPATELAVRCVH